MKDKQINFNVILLSMTLFFPAVSNYICTAINMLLSMVLRAHISQGLFDGMIWTLVIALCIPVFVQKLNARHLFVMLCLWLAALLMCAFGLSAEFNTERLIALCLTLFPMFLVGSVIELKKEDFKYLYWIAIFVVIISVAYQYYKISGGDVIKEDNMDFSYKLLPAVLVVVSGMFYNKKKALSIILGVAAIVTVILQGTRGPVLCIGIFLIIMLVKRFGILKLIPAIIALLALVIAFSSSEVYETTMTSIAEFVEDMGMSPRFIEMFLEEELADDNGRQELYDAVLAEIGEHPFKFRGLYADREILNPITGSNNSYVHNILYELIIDFGAFFGVVIFLAVIISTLVAIIKTNMEKLYLVNLLAMSGFVMLFVSGSFADDYYIYVLMGVVCQAKLSGKKGKKQDEIAVDM